ncbi:MAG: 6-phosphogluconolactonase [Candidatus Cloacimonetes bacterium]|nr:6-phosphogluconolactonase [Candidatus Cloacimonadota bacterium]
MYKQLVNIADHPNITICITADELSLRLATLIAALSAKSINERGRFTLAIPGGSALDIASRKLDLSPLRDEIEWSAWQVFWVDERIVPFKSSESNSGNAYRQFFSKVNVPQHHLHSLDDTVKAESAADSYEAMLNKEFNLEKGEFPSFDLILLGIGEDGHIASLFPDHPVLKEDKRLVVPVFDSPKPPAERISMTLPVINNARNVVFAVSGSGKAAILSRILGPSGLQPELPAQLVKPIYGKLHWFADQAAAEMLDTRAYNRTKISSTQGASS